VICHAHAHAASAGWGVGCLDVDGGMARLTPAHSLALAGTQAVAAPSPSAAVQDLLSSWRPREEQARARALQITFRSATAAWWLMREGGPAAGQPGDGGMACCGAVVRGSRVPLNHLTTRLQPHIHPTSTSIHLLARTKDNAGQAVRLSPERVAEAMGLSVKRWGAQAPRPGVRRVHAYVHRPPLSRGPCPVQHTANQHPWAPAPLPPAPPPPPLPPPPALRPRAASLVSSAMRAVPLVADPEPLDVVLEDPDFLAVNKPAGVQTAPVHRFLGGSMVNRAITRQFWSSQSYPGGPHLTSPS
jgi:hypothetical protein